MSNQNSYLNIKVKTWEDDTFELIEYQNYNYFNDSFTVKENGSLTRSLNKRQINFHTNKEKTPKKQFELLKIFKNSENFSVGVGKNSNDLKILEDCDPAFLVLKGNKMDSESFMGDNKRIYKLNQGDIIKLGRVYLKVLDIVIKKNDKECNDDNMSENTLARKINESPNINSVIINGQKVIKGTLNVSSSKNKTNTLLIKLPNEDLDLIDKNNKKELDSISNLVLPENNVKKNQNSKSDNKKICRICYSGEENEENNPLLCPCICKGSMKYIHYKCLKIWLNSKIEASNNNQLIQNPLNITYIRDELKCELCNTELPDFIKYKNQLLNISIYDQSKFKQYIIFESLRVGGDRKKSIHILSLDNFNQYTIGRGCECDLIFDELSVSRYHCLLYRENDEIYIQDNHSKFATLVLIQNPNIILLNKKPLRIQRAKTYIKINLCFPFNLFSCCNANILEQKYKINSYEIQNKKYLDKKKCFVIKENKNVESDEEIDCDRLLDLNNNSNDEKSNLEPVLNRRKSSIEIKKCIKNKIRRNDSKKLSHLAEISNNMFIIGDNELQDGRKKNRAMSIRIKKGKIKK